MAVTLDTIKTQIAKLEKQAQDIVAKEKKAAIKEIKALIKKYDISADEVRLESKRGPVRKTKAKTGAKSKARTKRKPAKVLYQKDDLTWSGRGRKPHWVNEIIAAEGVEGMENYRV